MRSKVAGGQGKACLVHVGCVVCSSVFVCVSVVFWGALIYEWLFICDLLSTYVVTRY